MPHVGQYETNGLDAIRPSSKNITIPKAKQDRGKSLLKEIDHRFLTCISAFDENFYHKSTPDFSKQLSR